MKKFFMFAAMASVALVSCVKSEPNVNLTGSEGNLISFESPILAPSVKSVQEIVQFPADKTFQIWAYYTQNNFEKTQVATNEYMNDVEIAYRTVGEDKLWKAADKYYWPNSGYLTFVAYSGTVTADDVTETGLKFNYTVNANADEDLLVSQVNYNVQRPATPSQHSQSNYNGQVQVLFEHALSSLVFKVKSGVYQSNSGAGAINTDLAVTKIEVLGVHNTGSFSQGFADWKTGDQMLKPLVSGDPATAVVTDGWSSPDGDADYVAFTSETVGHQVLTGNHELVHDKTAATADYALSNLIVLPQAIPDEAELKITYDFRNDSMGTDVWITGNTATAKLSTDYVAAWMRGYRYTYNVTLTLDEITFDPEVSAWVDYVPADTANDHLADYQN